MFLRVINKILVLNPHADDGEFGCGGTVARLLQEGKEIFYAVFSLSEKSLFDGLPKDTHEKELQLAVKALGIPENNLTVFRYPVRDFPEYRQDILENLVSLQKDIDPDLVLLPSTCDIHQDHLTISQEGFRAFKKTNMLGYELPWNTTGFKNQAFIALDESHIAAKMRAGECYDSQKGKRPYASGEYVKSLAIVRGASINNRYAEAFEAVRIIV